MRDSATYRGCKLTAPFYTAYISLDFFSFCQYNLTGILDCHRVVSESACLHIVRS